MALNIDLAPTFLDIAGISPKTLSHLEGSSLLPWLRGETPAWRDHIIYEYYWEWNFPATPSTFAIRTDRYKYIFYHGVWDRNGLYDLELDPLEKHNLIELPAYKETVITLQNRLFEALQNPEEVSLPIRPPVGEQYYDRKLRR